MTVIEEARLVTGHTSESDEGAFQETIIHEVESCRKTLEEADKRRLTWKQIMELEDRIEVCLECALESS
jgi:hypothetical protein